MSRLINAECRATGGFDNIAYLANLDDITSVTRDAVTKVVTAITMVATKKFYKWVGRAASFDSTGEKASGQRDFTQGLGLVLDLSSALDIWTFEQLCRAKKIVAVVLSNDDTYMVFGLGITDTGLIRPGLSGLATDSASMNRTAELDGETGGVVRLTGVIGNIALIFSIPTGTIATNRAYLETLVV